MFNNSRIFISGASGSWGKTLIGKLLDRYTPKEIICFSRGELNQVMLKRLFPQANVKYVIGDVRDYNQVEQYTKDVDYIFHLAALKHVPVCEDYPEEAIKTNINGTINIINAAIKNKVKKVIDVSTDKAANPLNLYGLTKAVGEKLIINAANKSDTKFVCIRGGNVMGSNGSVIPLFINQIKNGGPITITDMEMTRYFLTLEEAIDLLFIASEASSSGETYVMKMPACKIIDLAEVLMETYGEAFVQNIGIREGEKIHEVLVTKEESKRSFIYNNDYYLISPKSQSHLPKVDFEEYSSNTYLMNKNQIREMLLKGKFI